MVPYFTSKSQAYHKRMVADLAKCPRSLLAFIYYWIVHKFQKRYRQR